MSIDDTESEIKIFSAPEAGRLVYDVIASHISNASLFRGKILGFIASLYEKGYVIGQANYFAREKLWASFAKKQNVTVGKVRFFDTEYAQSCFLHHAEFENLPVAMIKKYLILTVNSLYAQSFIFGSCLNDDAQVFIHNWLAKYGEAKLVLKDKEPQPTQPTEKETHV